MISLPSCVYTRLKQYGRYGGGVKLAEGFDPYRRKLTARQAALLIKLSAQLTGDELSILDSILRQFAP